MRRALLAVLLLVAVASAADTTEIHVYRRGKVLGYDKDVGESLNEALIETWACETGEVQKTERLETYLHHSEDGGVQVAFNEWKDDTKAAQAITRSIEGRIDLSSADRYYVLRSFGWQRYHDHDSLNAAVFYERCIKLEPRWSSAHYGFALVKRD